MKLLSFSAWASLRAFIRPLMFAGKNSGFMELMMLNRNWRLIVFVLPSIPPDKSGKYYLSTGSLSAPVRRVDTFSSMSRGTFTILTWLLWRHYRTDELLEEQACAHDEQHVDHPPSDMLAEISALLPLMTSSMNKEEQDDYLPPSSHWTHLSRSR